MEGGREFLNLTGMRHMSSPCGTVSLNLIWSGMNVCEDKRLKHTPYALMPLMAIMLGERGLRCVLRDQGRYISRTSIAIVSHTTRYVVWLTIICDEILSAPLTSRMRLRKGGLPNAMGPLRETFESKQNLYIWSFESANCFPGQEMLYTNHTCRYMI